jgi:pimeloyl-ACP methyl ester carboxylesterase
MDVTPPYVLVGHSIGGIHVRVYQNMYPNDVVGVVLVDSGHPDQWRRLPPQLLKWNALRKLDFKLGTCQCGSVFQGFLKYAVMAPPKFEMNCGQSSAMHDGLKHRKLSTTVLTSAPMKFAAVVRSV